MLKPLFNRVLIKESTPEEKTTSGIYLPDVLKEKKNEGVVIEVGHETTILKVGDNVMFGKNTGIPTSYEGNDYLLMRETDVLAIL